jgi:hypothetical protein
LQANQDQLEPIIEALCAGLFADYESKASAFTKAHTKEALWSALAVAHGVALDVLERLIAWPVEGIRASMRWLMPAVEHLQQLPLEDAERFLLYSTRVPQSFRHAVAELLRPHLARSPELGAQLGERVRSASVQNDGAARVWALAFSGAAQEAAARYAVSLRTGSASDLSLMAQLIQFLPIASEQVRAVIVPLEAELASALASHAPDPSDDSWHALACIADASPVATETLMRAVEAGKPGAIEATCHWLHRVTAPTVGATSAPVEGVLAHLLRHARHDGQVRPVVDSAVAGMLYRATMRSAALQCIGALSEADGDLNEMFPETIDALCESPADFTRQLTTWLLLEGVTFAAVRSLLARCGQRRAHATIDPVVFAAADAQRKVVAARRLLALTHDGPALCQFIACLAESPALQPDGLNMASQMLNEAFAEYPAATEEFLKERTRAVARSEPFAAVYRGVYANVLRWRLVLRRLPMLNELKPTDAQLQALRGMRQRFNRVVMRGAEEQSVFASIVTKVHLAQGRRFATHTANGPPQIAEMQESGHSIELPSSERADPVGGMLRRAATLAASR